MEHADIYPKAIYFDQAQGANGEIYTYYKLSDGRVFEAEFADADEVLENNPRKDFRQINEEDIERLEFNWERTGNEKVS